MLRQQRSRKKTILEDDDAHLRLYHQLNQTILFTTMETNQITIKRFEGISPRVFQSIQFGIMEKYRR